MEARYDVNRSPHAVFILYVVVSFCHEPRGVPAVGGKREGSVRDACSADTHEPSVCDLEVGASAEVATVYVGVWLAIVLDPQWVALRQS